MIPRATYRLQFHKGFTFTDAARQADYLAALGISHVYASPILAARAGSLHGYDVVDHSRINPELGGEAGLRAMAAALRARGLGLILDIVPNHMAVGGAGNGWWLDVLAKGRASRFATAFDIDWDAPGLEGKVLAPFLDGAPQALWEKGDLTLARDPALGWSFRYFAHRFPLRPEDQAREAAPTSWEEAETLLARQHFLLADWRQADARINWRRFFDITDLAALRVAEPAVFEAVHAKVFALYGEGIIDGVRVDHIDGLADPAAYCRLLHRRLSALRPEPYLVVEKILAEDEALPGWAVQGTTGYDAMNDLSALLHADDGGLLEEMWQGIGARGLAFEGEEQAARREMLETKFQSQLDAVARAFTCLCPDLPIETLRDDLTRVIVALRCYRGYATGKADSPGPGQPLSRALEQAPRLRPLFARRDGDPALVDALRRFHQLTAPVAAKAVEDTAFYRYGRLLSRNDVGFDPRRAWLSPRDFHARVQRRAAAFPQAMLAVATHDHKRGADTRARLAALSAVPHLWRDFARTAPQDPAIHPADAYMLFQTLAGAWPGQAGADFAGRIQRWCVKHLREAKLRSSWQAPDTDYEQRFCAFARRLILEPEGAESRVRLRSLLEAIAPLAESNSLVQAVLHLTLPGVPDLYQGCEFGDFSLVDPDNRRPVDYAARAVLLAAPDGSFDARKQQLVARLLHARRRQPALWAEGTYEPVAMPDGFIAFARRRGGQGLHVIARCNGRMEDGTILTLPQGGYDILAERNVAPGPSQAARLFAQWPALVLLTGAGPP